MIGEIWLEGMEFFAFHGCFEHERKEGNTFIVDLKVKTDISKAAISDKLEDSLDYGVFYEIVKTEMEIPSNLLENVAGRIIEKLKLYSNQIAEIELLVSKKNPPITGKAIRSAVKINYIKN